MSRLKDEVLLRLASEGVGISSQQELAPLIGITPGQLSRILSNARRRLSAEQVGRFAQFLDVTPAEVREILRHDYEQDRRRWDVDISLPVEYDRDRDDRVEDLSDQLRDLRLRVAQLENLLQRSAPDLVPVAQDGSRRSRP